MKARSARPGGLRTPEHYPSLRNKPGVLMNLPKNNLKVDSRYQRMVNRRAVQRICDNWNWVACGSLIVSIRKDDPFCYIVDGQHRWEAAKLNPDVTDLACLAFEINDVQEEARGFLAANTERQLPKMADKFNALMVIGDKDAKVADELIREAGRTIAYRHSKTHFSPITELMRCLKRDTAATRRIWPLLVQLTRDTPIPGFVLKGLFYLELRMPSGTSLSDNRFKDRLLHVGYENICIAIQQVATIEGFRSERVCGQGVLRAFNKNARNPLRINME